MAQGAAGYHHPRAADGGAGADDLAFPSAGPEPTSGQLGLFVGLSFFDALAWGLGIAWLLFALLRLRRIAGGSELRAWAMYLSIGWALVSWWPHSNMHRSNGDDLWGLLLIDYIFHPTLMLSALVLGWSLLTLPAAGASGSPLRCPRTRAPGAPTPTRVP